MRTSAKLARRYSHSARETPGAIACTSRRFPQSRQLPDNLLHKAGHLGMLAPHERAGVIWELAYVQHSLVARGSPHAWFRRAALARLGLRAVARGPRTGAGLPPPRHGRDAVLRRRHLPRVGSQRQRGAGRGHLQQLQRDGQPAHERGRFWRVVGRRARRRRRPGIQVRRSQRREHDLEERPARHRRRQQRGQLRHHRRHIQLVRLRREHDALLRRL